MASEHSARWALLAVLLPTVLAVVVFVPHLGGDFVADTYQFLALLDVLGQQGHTVREAFASDAYQTTLLPLYRPLSLLSLAVDYHAFGLDPFAFRLVNVAVHVIAALVIGRVASLVTGVRAVGLGTACLFAISPMSAEAVYWASTRGTLLAAAFGSTALLALVVREQRRRAGVRWTWALQPLALVCLACALLAQETAVAFVPVLAVATYAVQRERGVVGVGVALRRTAWTWILLAAYLLWRRRLLGKWVGGYGGGAVAAQIDILDLDFWQQRLQHLLTAISPVHLGVFPMAAKVGFGALTLVALAMAAVHAMRTPRLRPWVAIAVTWVTCFCLPSAFLVVDAAQLTNGRLLYVQSAGLLSLVAVGAVGAAAIGWRPRLASIALGVAVACCAATLWGNLRPWRAAGELAGSLRQQIVAADPGTELLLADLPFDRNGASVATGAIALPPFVPSGCAPRTAFLDSEQDLLLHWLAQRGDTGFTVWRFDPARARLTPQTLTLPRPQDLTVGGRVLAARSRWLDASTLGVDALVTPEVAAAVGVRVLDAQGTVLASGELQAGGPSPAGDVRRARLALPPGEAGDLRVELADGPRWLSVDVAARQQGGGAK